MKKLISYLLILMLAFAMLTGCGGSSEAPADDPGAESEESLQDGGEAADSGQEPDVSGLGGKLADVYFDMAEKGNYFMQSKMTVTTGGQSTTFETDVAVSGDNMAVTTKGPDMDMFMVFKDGKTYMVDHSAKTVTVMQGADTESQDIAFDTEGITFLGSGKEDGLTYEEYTSPDGSTSKYYFDGKKLVKIKMNYSYGDSSEVEILEMTDKVPGNAFDIPSGYEQIEL